jgi:hypothetical protein
MKARVVIGFQLRSCTPFVDGILAAAKQTLTMLFGCIRGLGPMQAAQVQLSYALFGDKMQAP